MYDVPNYIKILKFADSPNAIFDAANVNAIADSLTAVAKNLEDLNWPEYNAVGHLYNAYYRAEIADTIKKLEYGKNTHKISSTKTYQIKSFEELKSAGYQIYTDSKIEIRRENMLLAAQELSKQRELSVAMLNPENEEVVGGGAFCGAPNFEEDLFRLSSLCLCLLYFARENGDISHNNQGRPLYSKKIKLKHNEAHFTDKVTFIKKIISIPGVHWYAKKFELLAEDSWWSVSIVGNAAVYLQKNQKFTDEDVVETKSKIRAHLSAAIQGGSNCIVLTDFGCGGFNNPPYEIAKIYAEILINEKYGQFFKVVRFSIINPEHEKIFQEVFGNVLKQQEKLTKKNNKDGSENIGIPVNHQNDNDNKNAKFSHTQTLEATVQNDAAEQNFYTTVLKELQKNIINHTWTITSFWIFGGKEIYSVENKKIKKHVVPTHIRNIHAEILKLLNREISSQQAFDNVVKIVLYSVVHLNCLRSQDSKTFYNEILFKHLNINAKATLDKILVNIQLDMYRAKPLYYYNEIPSKNIQTKIINIINSTSGSHEQKLFTVLQNAMNDFYEGFFEEITHNAWVINRSQAVDDELSHQNNINNNPA